MTKNNNQAEPGNEEQNVSPGEARASQNDENIVNKIWNLLSSMKLGIILLLLLAVASIVGTIWVPTDQYGQQDFTVYYNNPLFKLLLGLLALNLFVCSLNRWKAITSTLKGPKADVSEGFVKNLKSGSSVKLKNGPIQVGEKVKDLLRKRGYRVFTKQDGEVFKVSSDRGHLGIFGPYLTHLSFIIVIGAIIIKFSNIVGFDGSLEGFVGETYSLGQVQGIQNVDPAEYFDIKIDNFRTDYRPDGSVKQWYSDVTVIDNGQAQPSFTIYVNNPLVYKGVKFYQSFFGSRFSGTLTGPTAKDQPFTVNTRGQQYVQAAGTDITFMPFVYDAATKTIGVAIYKGNTPVAENGVALNTSFKYENAEVKFTWANNYTGLSVKKDPGVPVIGAGSILLIFGVMISFLLRQRRIWSVVAPDKDGSIVYLGGIAAKDKRGLDNDLEEVMTQLKN